MTIPFEKMTYEQKFDLCASVRGFNYQPSNSAYGVKIWTELDREKTKAELYRGKELFPHTNTIRIWLSYDAYLCDKKVFLSNLEFVMNTLGELDLKAVLVLFNGWHSVPDVGGLSVEVVRFWNDDTRNYVFLDYIDDLLDKYAQDPRVFMWDLCNEPFNSGGEKDYVAWLKKIYAHIKKRGASAPIGVGVHPDLDAIKLLEPVSDILTPHMYVQDMTKDEYNEFVQKVADYAKSVQKPLVSTEMGWGRLDDMERIELLKIELDAMLPKGFGVLIHLLSYSPVADAHRPEDGIINDKVGFMGCIEKDGSLRKGHEIINEYYR